MNLKHYIFILFALLLIGLFSLQGIWLHLSSQYLNEEVLTRSKTLSFNLLDRTIQDADLESYVIEMGNLEPVYRIPEQAILTLLDQSDWPHKDHPDLKTVIKDNQVLAFIMNANGQVKHLRIMPLPEHLKPAHDINTIESTHISERLKTTLQNLQTDLPIELSQKLEFVEHPSGFITHFENLEQNGIEQLLQKMYLLIAVTCLIALALGYLLSNIISTPINRLIKGFKALSDGELGTQVKASGIAEMKQSLMAFNQMSTRLARLSEQERHFQQVSHLADMGEVSRGLAHALRNPIHTIGLAAEQLENDHLPNDSRQQYLGQIQNKIHHVNQTLSALLTLTHQGLDRTQSVKLINVLNDIILEIKAGHRSDLNFQLPKSAIELMGCEEEIRAILHTLMVNAAEASPKNETILIQLSSNATHHIVHILDKGEGLSESVRHKLFTPHTSNKPEGAGMGLFIAQRMIKLFYQGEIELYNREQRGCEACAHFIKQEQTKPTLSVNVSN